MAVKGRMFKLLLMLLVVIVILTLAAHHAISSLAVSETPFNSHKTRTQLEYDNEQDAGANSKLMTSYQNEVEELRRIKMSVNNELRELENKRLKLQSDIASYTGNIDNLKSDQQQLNKETHKIRMALEQIRFEQEESKSFIPNIKAPNRILYDLDPMEILPMPSVSSHCSMESCFDFSRCSLVSGFPVYFYDPDQYFFNGIDLDPFIKKSFSEFFPTHAHRTREASAACIFVVLVGEIRRTKPVDAREIESFLFSLPNWRGDGRNHVLINVGRSPNNFDLFQGVNIGRAMLAQSPFTDLSFRRKFDVLIPLSLSTRPIKDVWKDLPPLSPVRRKYLLSYWGQYLPGKQTQMKKSSSYSNDTSSLSKNNVLSDRQSGRQQSKNNDNNGDNVKSQNIGSNRGFNFRPRRLLSVVDTSSSSSSFSFFSHIEQAIVSSIKSFQTKYPEHFYMEVSCNSPIPELTYPSSVPSDWLLCQPGNSRRDKILQSTFSLIVPPLNSSFYSSVAFQIRVVEALQNGAVPVILGSQGHLPLTEVINWETAAIFLPTPRVTEIPFFLFSIPDEDIAAYRLQGRHYYLNHFSSFYAIVNTVLAVVRTRLQIPAKPIQDEEFSTAFPVGFVPLKFEGPEPEMETDEVLGPIESPFASETYKHNFTQSMLGNLFNSRADIFNLYPYTPFHPLLPSEAKFIGSGFGFRPVGQGAGGDGINFSQAIGGNSPREQFTIVMLTYDREVVLIQALQRFKGLPFLNKVVVVWNNPAPPEADVRWPEIGVPILVAKTKRNSLNNRFLPYKVIDTEAILSIDDDAHLRHDEIVFGFRVWREERARVVGFPGRFHAWDAKHRSWNYNSNYSCELSMVLTGAAFFHKYYAYQYSYSMPQAIRDKVDEFMNCEDIAMNFLVAHISRKPPVKVTSRWTFRCPGCPTTLSSNSSHFEERHQCINFFTQVYGYMPLLYTQYRVDSVLFKTRISHDKTKCFKYI